MIPFHLSCYLGLARLLIAVFLILPFAALAQFNNASWSNVDRHALAAPAHLESNTHKLGAYLGEPFTDQASKLRAVFRWVTDRMQYDTDSFRRGRQNSQTAQQALSARVATCDGFSNLFEELAKHAGAPVVTVIGYAKDALHQKGEGFAETNHAWNLAEINGRWWLIDSTWGAGFDDGQHFVKQFDPFYFLIPPEQLVLTHFAHEAHRRVGHHSSNVSEFRALPYAPVTLLSLASVGLPDIQRARTEGFVQTFDLPRGSLMLRKGYLHQSLDKTRTHHWEVESNVYQEFAVIHNDNWTYFTRTGDGLFAASLIPQNSGKVQLAAKRSEDKVFTIFLEYGIK